ncbi:hypothetical protein DRN85_01605 [Methanosarcinales archaeon]|nr:MAG: hypothetical protein DRN85_01605 [Methanosarcinales archaeon]
MSLGFTIEPYGTVEEVIKSWKPRGCATEKEFEQSLSRKLEKELKNQKIQTQYGSGRQRVDIVVHKKVPIEVKKDLTTTSALQRTLGQVDQYLQDWDSLILVLCGDVAPDLLKSLKKACESKTDLGHMYDNRVFIIVK